MSLTLPPWLEERVRDTPAALGLEAQVGLAIDLARENVRRGTGGPFGAVVAARDGTILGMGVNLVVEAGCSVLHAEIVAIILAQRCVGTWDLGSAPASAESTLASSAEPCAMCLGALPWSGIRRLAFAARDGDVRGIGFDEGDKPPGWRTALEARGIAVAADVLRSDAIEVLERYRAGGGPIYGP